MLGRGGGESGGGNSKGGAPRGTCGETIGMGEGRDTCGGEK